MEKEEIRRQSDVAIVRHPLLANTGKAGVCQNMRVGRKVAIIAMLAGEEL
jgi:hypothetical protein